MQAPRLPEDEGERIEALLQCELLDTAPEQRFDRITRLAAHIFAAPIALVSLVDRERQWFKSRVGLDATETPRSISFCGHAILDDETLVVADAAADPRFADNPLVTGEPHIRFYMGAVLHSDDGQRVGTLCVIDRSPRQPSREQLALLRDLADCVENELRQSRLAAQEKAMRLLADIEAFAPRDPLARLHYALAAASDYLQMETGLVGRVYERDCRIEVLHPPSAGAREGQRFALAGSPCALACAADGVVAHGDLDARGLALPPCENGEAPSSFIGVALRGESGTIGSLSFTSTAKRADGRFSEAELDFVQHLGRWIGKVLLRWDTERELQRQYRLGEAIARAQSQFILAADRRSAFDRVLEDLLSLTESEYGFIGEVLREADGTPYLKTYAITNIAWNEATRAFYDTHAPSGMEFRNLHSLFGAVMTSAAPVIANSPADDPRRAGLPAGHPAMRAFLGIPILHQERLVAMLGLANRPGGYDEALVAFLQPLLLTIGQLVEALRADSERRQVVTLLANVLDAAHEVSIIATDAEGLMTLFNRGAERMLGYRADELLGRHSPAIIHLPEEVAQRSAELSAASGHPIEGFRTFVHLPETQGSETREWTYRRKDGSTLPVSLTVTTMRDDGGAIVGYLGIAQDISERKRSEQALRDQAEHTQTLLDTIVDGILSIDARGTVLSCNPAAERIFGYPAEAVIGHNVNMLMPSPYRENHDRYLHDYLATGVARIIGIGREVEGRRQDGSVFPMELSVSELRRQGQPLFVGVVRDISERKRSEQLKSEFVSTVSHELRTPLTAISGALGLVAGGALGELPAAMRDMVGIAHKNSKRLTYLINDLLDMEKLVAGKMHFELHVQPLHPLLEQAVDANRTYGGERGVGIVLHGEGDALVRVDGQRLLQVLSNLLSNAIKYSPDGGRVEVASRVAGGSVRVSVSDSGPGIPAQFRNRIFEKFSQADASDTRQKGGTGLGLAITRELVERMGGRIGFESVEGHGACFHFDLPLQLASDDDSDRALPAPIAGERILVVEDDPDIARLLVLLLLRAGYDAQSAGSGAEALDALTSGGFAAMTLDLLLPDIDGLELIRRIRQQTAYAEFPIIVVSARMEEGRLALGGDVGAIDWLAKPIEEPRLLAAVERLLPHHGDRPWRVLHIEDDPDLHAVVRGMAGERFQFAHAASLAEADRLSRTAAFDVVLLDIGLPDGSGWDLLPLLRQRLPQARVVILSGTDTAPTDARHVDAVLLKSRVSPRELLDAIESRMPHPAETTP